MVYTLIGGGNMGKHKKQNEISEERFKPAGNTILDSKKRITIGKKILEEEPLKSMEIDGFEVFIGEEGDILLKPMANIPSRELWVHQNPEVLKSIQKGIRDIKEGRVTKVKKLDKFFKEL